MRRSVGQLTGCAVHAKDGEIGTVEEFYFDDHSWTVRYMIVNTGTWLSGREVLISTVALRKPAWKARAFPVNLTRRQVENSPGIDTAKPVSRQHESLLHEYYGWPIYWGVNPFMGVGYPMPMIIPSIPENKKRRPAGTPPPDHHLRSTDEVTGYRIHATDGEIGHVQDFIVDDRDWTIRFIVVNTGNWLSGRHVLVSPAWIKSVKWEEASVAVRLSRQAVRNSPAYDPSKPVSPDYEIRLFDHYERKKNLAGLTA